MKKTICAESWKKSWSVPYVARKMLSVVALATALSIFASNAMASSVYGFTRLTANNAENVASQLTMTVWDTAEANLAFAGLGLTDEILFTFTSNVGVASSISEIYFDDGGPGIPNTASNILSTPQIIFNNLGGFTNFIHITQGQAPGANPANLPSGNNIGFEAEQAFSADAVGNPSEGVDAAADILGLAFDYNGGDFSDVIAAPASGNLRVGLHLRSIGANAGSDSFFNGPEPGVPPAKFVPIPAAAWLFGSALLGIIGFARRRTIAA